MGWTETVQVDFHEQPDADEAERRKAVYVRSAYRNDPAFQTQTLGRVSSVLFENQVSRMIDNDATVARNYIRLASQGLEDVFEREDPNTTIGQFREKVLGEIRSSLSALFPDLVLSGVGNPLSQGTFSFSKGASQNFEYLNLSGGEKAAFDILLDFVVKRRHFNNTVFCIDEPDAHMNTRLQGALLAELFRLLPEKCQLWIATHSIGMMRRARDLALSNPGQVLFLDLGDHNFDQPQVIVPVKPTRAFWANCLNVALDDLSELVAPSRVVICEGAPRGSKGKHVAVDAQCYELIFGDEFPETVFLASGSAGEVEADRLALLEAIKALVAGTEVTRLIDRDDLSDNEVAERLGKQIRVLSRRHIESYLYDDAVLTALCREVGKPSETAALLTAKAAAMSESAKQGHSANDVKSASGQIYNAAKRLLGLTNCGNTAKSFMLATLAPLVGPEMAIYKELRHDIFGT